MIIVGDDNDDLCMNVCMYACKYICMYAYMYICIYSMYVYVYIHKFLTTELVIFSVYHVLYVPPLTTGSGDWNGHSYLP